MTTWYRLAALSQEHANRIGVCPRRHRTHTPPDVIIENVEILRRAGDEEMKHRVHWYITFHPAIFDACSARKWEYPNA